MRNDRASTLLASLFASTCALLFAGCGGDGGASAEDLGEDESMLGEKAPMWIGAAVNRPASSVASFEAAANRFGPWRVRRSFDHDIPVDIAHSAAADDETNHIVTFLSVKPPSVDGVAAGAYDARLRSLAASFPRDHATFLTMFHEPENDMPGHVFKVMFRHFYEVVKAANPAIHVGTVHMSYQWRPHASATLHPDDWWVGADATDFIGVDDYNDATTDGRTTAKDDPQFQRWYAWAKTKGKPLAVVEYGRVEDPTDPGALGRELVVAERWLRNHDFFMFLYWDAIGDKHFDWRLHGGATRDAMRAIASRGRAAW